MWSYTEIEKFAKNNAGRKIRVIDRGEIPARNEESLVGRIIGYDNNRLIIEFDKNLSPLSWESSWDIETTDSVKNHYVVLLNSLYPTDSMMKFIGRGWKVRPNGVELLSEKQTTLYPNICKSCKSQARKIGGLIFCSNVYCKTRSAIRKIYKPEKIQSKEIPCPKCQYPATSATNNGSSDLKGVSRRLSCNGGHSWTYVPKLGDILKCSLYRTGKHLDYVWIGHMFAEMDK